MNNRFVWVLVTICLVIALCLPASAGINQAFALQSLTGSHEYQSMPQSPGELTIYGRWLYPDRSGGNVPAKRFIVYVYTDNNPWLAYDYTDDSGNFIIGPFANPNPGKIKVKIYTWYHPVAGHDITVAPPGGNSWYDAHVYTPEGDGFGPFDDGTRMLDEALVVPSNYDQKKAFWIKNDLQDGFDFIPSKTGDYFALWQNGIDFRTDALAFFVPSTTCKGIVGCVRPKSIHINYLTPSNTDARDVILSEFGHAVMWFAFGQNAIETPSCEDHQFYASTSQGCAWSEGWAYFFSVADLTAGV